MPTLTTFTQHIGSPNQEIRQEKKKKVIKTGKKEVKPLLFKDDLLSLLYRKMFENS